MAVERRESPAWHCRVAHHSQACVALIRVRGGLSGHQLVDVQLNLTLYQREPKPGKG